MKYSDWDKDRAGFSQLGLGTVALGMPYGLDNAHPPCDADCIALIHRAMEAGIHYIDTASAYGRSEELVGKACASTPFDPVVCTKITVLPEGDAPSLIPNFKKQLEQSRHLLGLDTLPLVKLHSQQGAFTFPALFEAMIHFSELGWVDRWGVSTYGLAAPLHALSFPDVFTALQVPYNALDRSAASDLFPQARDAGIDIVVRSIFLQGLLSESVNRRLPPTMSPLANALSIFRETAADAGLSPAELALRYVAYQEGIRVTLFGSTLIEELEQNLRFYEAGPLPADLIERIQDIEVADRDLLNPGNWPPHYKRIGASR
ncbi:MAG: aldo/keto reductase [Candidatus Latescibacterota bacterium]